MARQALDASSDAVVEPSHSVIALLDGPAGEHVIAEFAPHAVGVVELAV